MSYFDPQNPGIGGLQELTPAEALFLTTFAGRNWSDYAVVFIDSNGNPNQDPGLFEYREGDLVVGTNTPYARATFTGETITAPAPSGTVSGVLNVSGSYQASPNYVTFDQYPASGSATQVDDAGGYYTWPEEYWYEYPYFISATQVNDASGAYTANGDLHEYRIHGSYSPLPIYSSYSLGYYSTGGNTDDGSTNTYWWQVDLDTSPIGSSDTLYIAKYVNGVYQGAAYIGMTSSFIDGDGSITWNPLLDEFPTPETYLYDDGNYHIYKVYGIKTGEDIMSSDGNGYYLSFDTSSGGSVSSSPYNVDISFSGNANCDRYLIVKYTVYGGFIGGYITSSTSFTDDGTVWDGGIYEYYYPDQYIDSWTPQNHTIRVYTKAVAPYSGAAVYSSTYIEGNFVGPDDGSTYGIDWSWDAVSGVDDYRVLVYADIVGYNFDKYYDVSTNSLYDDSNPLNGNTVTPTSTIDRALSITGGINLTQDTKLTMAGTDRLFFKSSNGYVGWGTQTPLAPLHISGGATINLQTVPLYLTSSGVTRIYVDTTQTNGNTGFTLTENGAKKWTMASYRPTGTNRSFTFYNEQGSLADAFFINGDTNNVSIGQSMTTPASRLVVKGSNTSSSNSALNVTNSSNSSLLFVRNDGNVGIGTSSPTTPFYVQYSDNNFLGGVTVKNTNTGNHAVSAIQIFRADGISASFALVNDNWAFSNPGTAQFASNVGLIFHSDNTGSATHDIGFAVGSGAARVMTVQGSTQRLGIGTLSPSAKVHVQGAASAITSIFQQNATGTANITEWRNSSGSAIAYIDSSGSAHFGDIYGPGGQFQVLGGGANVNIHWTNGTPGSGMFFISEATTASRVVLRAGTGTLAQIVVNSDGAGAIDISGSTLNFATQWRASAGGANGTLAWLNGTPGGRMNLTATASSTQNLAINITAGTHLFEYSGRIGILETNPSAYLHLPAGSTTAGFAPLKFKSGSLLTTAEAGAVEFLTDKFYGTITTGAARKEFLMGDNAITDGVNIVTGTSTGTKIGTATTQKLGFWDATPDVQPTTAITAAAFVANTSGIVDDSATYGGYTMGQVVAALKRIGALA